MISVSGVGEIKYDKYGKEFENIIKDYLNMYFSKTTVEDKN